MMIFMMGGFHADRQALSVTRHALKTAHGGEQPLGGTRVSTASRA
ncbi:hypothetical protein [Paraburkholderia bannensis]|nr:hypothetical protein [Paraburkholderia bannensis]